MPELYSGELKRQFDAMAEETASLRDIVSRIEIGASATRVELKEQMDAIAAAIRTLSCSEETLVSMREDAARLERSIAGLAREVAAKNSEITRLKQTLQSTGRYIRVLNFDTFLLIVICALAALHILNVL